MPRVGSVRCNLCGCQDAPVDKTATGTLSVKCHKCEFSGFAKPGTRAHRLISQAMTPDDDDGTPAPAAPKPPKPPKLPPELPGNAIPAPPKAGFSLGAI